MLKYITVLIFLLLCIIKANAQNTDRLKNQSWVRIMQNDTAVNFFVAQKDFAKFRLQHNKEEAKEAAKRKKEASNGPRLPNEPHLENREEGIIKAYQRWAKSIKPFVSSTGKVMPVEQRVALTQKQKK